MRRLQIGVAGSGSGDQISTLLKVAKQVGREIARNDAILVFGGSEKDNHLPNAAYHSAHSEGGDAIAIVEGTRRDLFNQERTILIPCGASGRAWERAMAHSCDALIVISGKEGTLEEMRTAYENRAVIISIVGTGGMADAWAGKALDERNLSIVVGVSNASDAVQRAIELSKSKI